MKKRKFALIILGRDENLGMMFVGGEVKETGHEPRFFDGDDPAAIEAIAAWEPDYVCFSPLCIDEDHTLGVCRTIKERLPDVISVFGGPHILALSSIEGGLQGLLDTNPVDMLVVGPVRGAVDLILDAKPTSILRTEPTTPADMPSPLRREFYESIPRLADFYAKSMISMFGCPFDCAFCSNYVKRSAFGPKVFKNYFLQRRPIPELIKEGKVLLDFDTVEVDWEDDDILFGSDIEQWLPEFADAWKEAVDLPIRFMASPNSVISVSERVLAKLRQISCWAIIGVQCGSRESLELFNRTWQSEKMAKAAHDRLRSFGFSVLMQAIVGLPVEDPVEDAVQTVMALKRIGQGSFANAFPLLLYPGTRLYHDCVAKGLPLNEDALQNMHYGLPSIQFSEDIVRKIRNISKLTKIFVKYGLDESWIRPLIEIKDLGEETHKMLASAGYEDCVRARWPDDAQKRQQISSSLGNGYLKY